MTIFFTVLHVLVCVILIVVVLLQRGKGAEIGAVFGGGGGSTVFGARGAGNFLTRLTSGAAVTFMVTSLVLAYFARESTQSTLFQDNPSIEESASPFEEVAPAAEPEPASPFEEVAPAVELEPEAAEPEATEPEAAAPEAAEPAAAEPAVEAVEPESPETP
ncbi:MAG: preprotein translocase subunit SecG [Myxococcota bacterium]|nr:preprotein translocase subunit SecG [Myxococcota bacterium]